MRKPALSVNGTRLFLACLPLDLHLIAAIVMEERDIFTIRIQIDAEFIEIAQPESRTAHLATHLEFVDTQSAH